MKKNYVKPIMDSEHFVANEYVAACYVLSCNAPGEYGGWAYQEKDGKLGYTDGTKDYGMYWVHKNEGSSQCTTTTTLKTDTLPVGIYDYHLFSEEDMSISGLAKPGTTPVLNETVFKNTYLFYDENGKKHLCTLSSGSYSETNAST